MTSARELRLMDVLRERGVDGIINAAVRVEDARMERFAEDLPMVTVNRKIENSAIPSVISDDVGGVRMMVRRLAQSGHRRIGHIAGPPDLSTGLDRRAAFETAMRALGHDDPARLIATASRYTEAEGARCTDLLLDRGEGITAILCANDRLAIGALEALRARGLSCPGDVSVTGFNDIPFLDLIPPGLTTVQILQFEIGRTAAEILVKMMTAPDKRVPAMTILPVSIVERGSIGPANRPDAELPPRQPGQDRQKPRAEQASASRAARRSRPTGRTRCRSSGGRAHRPPRRR